MPFTIKGSKTKGYRLYNTDKKEFAKRIFKTREAAENMKKTYMAYDNKKSKKKKKSKY